MKKSLLPLLGILLFILLLGCVRPTTTSDEAIPCPVWSGLEADCNITISKKLVESSDLRVTLDENEQVRLTIIEHELLFVESQRIRVSLESGESFDHENRRASAGVYIVESSGEGSEFSLRNPDPDSVNVNILMEYVKSVSH